MNEGVKKKAKRAYELAYKYEKDWGACSQCTIKALQEVYNEENSDIFQALGGFAAGGACECDGICGAYAAGIYFFGTKKGRRVEDIGRNASDPKALKKHGRSYYIADPQELEKFDKAGAHEWGCTSVCGDGAQWVVEIFEDFMEKNKK